MTLIQLPSRLSQVLPDVTSGAATIADMGRAARGSLIAEIVRELQHLYVVRGLPEAASMRPTLIDPHIGAITIYLPVWAPAYRSRVRVEFCAVLDLTASGAGSPWPYAKLTNQTSTNTTGKVEILRRAFTSGGSPPSALYSGVTSLDLDYGSGVAGDFGVTEFSLEVGCENTTVAIDMAIFGISVETYQPPNLDL